MLTTIKKKSTLFIRFPNKLIRFTRSKHKENHWSVQRKLKSSKELALEHFDDFYADIFKKEWNSIRHGLMKKQKYMALINNYSDSNETMKKLEDQGAINVRVLFDLERERLMDDFTKNEKVKFFARRQETNSKVDVKTDKELQVHTNYSLESSLKNAKIDSSRLIDTHDSLLVSNSLFEFVPTTKIKGMEDYITESSHYKYYDMTELNVPIEREYTLNFPKTLNIYSYEQENDTIFDSPKLGTTGVLNYYLLDGGSLLPVLALDVRKGQTILDMCSAPGGKSLIALQTLMPDFIVCNDISKERIDRIYNVFKTYLYDLNERWIDSGKLKITKEDGRYIQHGNYDRIIVDVPCTTDRHSLKISDNNIFKSSRLKERLKLPELQSELLTNGLKLLKVGGFLVYSTCTLSPIQNDGVVHSTLRKFYDETDMKFVIKDLGPALMQSRCLYKLSNKSLRYGHLVLPFGPLNFGPTYFCKIQRIN